MTVKELIEELQSLPAEAEVILQKDSEGNGYSPCAGVDGPVRYKPESTWSGQAYDDDDREYLVEEEEELTAEEWEALQRVVVLFPVN